MRLLSPHYDLKLYKIIFFELFKRNIIIKIWLFENRDIWNKFLEFESTIGDLSSIVKTEKRRSTVLNQVGITLLIKFCHRFDFMTI